MKVFGFVSFECYTEKTAVVIAETESKAWKLIEKKYHTRENWRMARSMDCKSNRIFWGD